MADEHREPAQDHALQFREEPEAPIQRGLQRLLARRRGPRSEPQQGQALIEKRGGLLQPIGFDAPRRQFDGERHAVQPTAETSSCAPLATARFDEELDGGEGADDRRL